MAGTCPEDLAQIDRQSIDQLKPGEKYSIEYRMRKKDGEYMTWLDQIMVISDEKTGKPLKFIGAATDITERKKAEAAIYREKLLSDSIVANTPAGIAFLDNDFILRKYNNIYADLIRICTPYTPEQAMGMSYFDYASGSRPQVEEWFLKVKDTKQVDTRYGFKLVLKHDGQEKITYWDTSVAPVLDTEGKTKGILILTQDVTEHKKAEEKYEILFETSRDEIMTLNPLDWLFTSGNIAAIEMFGAKDETEFVSMAPWQYSPEFQLDGQLSVDKAKEMIIKAMKTGSNYFEWTHKKLDGTEFQASVLLTKVIINDKAFLQATVRDITERKKAEEDINNKNIALKELLEQISSEKQKIRDDICREMEREIIPLIKDIKTKKYNKLKDMIVDKINVISAGVVPSLHYKRELLTKREREISDLIKRGLKSKEIASNLGIAKTTVDNIRKNIRKKLGAKKGEFLNTMLE
ncbi:MAG: PAS domain S-box protein [Elusimicrobiota bacterium]